MYVNSSKHALTLLRAAQLCSGVVSVKFTVEEFLERAVNQPDFSLES